MLWVGWYENRFDLGKIAVDQRHRQFVVEINIVSEALDQGSCADHAAIVDQKATIEGVDLDSSVGINTHFGKARLNKLHSLFARKPRGLARVVHHNDVQLVEQTRSALGNI